ncbi:hypothetical protein BDF20DRAFT_866270 [Mycotypha africana]|uniref:uncharacterized protein n=1 Tax=Mycotypha africana TaxID=64632 RepID=UPI00230188E1|nr:uncharacterized protein BDF20DRAFT_866270 [Mycotypha africana]KAI8982324.1 hypothetical protein BDF20DRAFT_866270 [Mycotypha africana]
MTPAKKEAKKPSSRLLNMKFMQRSLEKEMRENLEKEKKRIASESEWVLDNKLIDTQKPKIQIQYETSYLPFIQNSVAARRSFKEFNKTVEAREQEEEQEQRLAREENVEKYSQMTDREFGNEMQTIRKLSKNQLKNNRKRARAAMKESSEKRAKPADTGFIKPE